MERRGAHVGPVIYNLGCGTRTSAACVNVDWSVHLRLRKWRLERLSGDRAATIRSVSGAIVLHDLRRGIPAASESVDVVYHSHVLEHLPREAVPRFMSEALRVLKPGGVHRIVVPDFEQQARAYVDGFGDVGHADRLAIILEQLVRDEAAGTSLQRPLRRRIENLLLGDARRRGETHRWMYDRLTLAEVLVVCGFEDVVVLDHRTSSIPLWNEIGLDVDGDARPYKPGSLYVEARKPLSHGD